MIYDFITDCSRPLEFYVLMKNLLLKKWHTGLLKYLLSAFTHQIVGHWTNMMRTIPNIGSLFEPLEDAVCLKLIPSLTGHDLCSAVERELLSLPCHLGGLCIVDPVAIGDSQYNATITITNSLKSLILQVCNRPSFLMLVPSR